MATNINLDGGGGNTGIAFIVGGLVVVVAAIGFAMAGGIWPFDQAADVNVQIEQPVAPAGENSGNGASTTTTTTTN